jgi:hypothetical protein
MNLKNPFRRDARPNSADKSEPILDVMRPWWAWGPLGLIWYGGHDSGSHNDPGQFHNPGDAGGHNHTVDPGGGFDGGAGGV